MERIPTAAEKPTLILLLESVAKALVSGPLMGACVFADDGPLRVHLGEKLGWKQVKLRENATTLRRAMFECIVELQQLVKGEPTERYELMMIGLLTGSLAAKFGSDLHNHDLSAAVAALTEHRASGGRASAKWTQGHFELASLSSMKYGAMLNPTMLHVGAHLPDLANCCSRVNWSPSGCPY